jgi:hypothetical protein
MKHVARCPISPPSGFIRPVSRVFRKTEIVKKLVIGNVVTNKINTNMKHIIFFQFFGQNAGPYSSLANSLHVRARLTLSSIQMRVRLDVPLALISTKCHGLHLLSQINPAACRE